MIPAATKTPGAQLPVASRRMPLTTGLSTAPISETRLSIPKAEPRSLAGTMSPVMPCTIGCRALKNSPEVNSSSPSSASEGLSPPETLQPKISTSTE